MAETREMKDYLLSDLFYADITNLPIPDNILRRYNLYVTRWHMKLQEEYIIGSFDEICRLSRDTGCALIKPLSLKNYFKGL